MCLYALPYSSLFAYQFNVVYRMCANLRIGALSIGCVPVYSLACIVVIFRLCCAFYILIVQVHRKRGLYIVHSWLCTLSIYSVLLCIMHLASCIMLLPSCIMHHEVELYTLQEGIRTNIYLSLLDKIRFMTPKIHSSSGASANVRMRSYM